jgi:hypothetical protein
MEQQKTSKNIKYFKCGICNFTCSKKGDYTRHIFTAKHKRKQNGTENTSIYIKLHNCVCGKVYKVKSGLWKHHKICSLVKEQCNKTISNTDDIANKEQFILDLLAQNKELMKILNKTIPKIGNNNTTNNTTNNQFNLQVFLNEDCKDAMNFSDFVKQIQVSLIDLENQAENGYIKGITKLFIDNLQVLGMNNRPIHCTDKKRKTLYIKENDEWDKEGSQDILKKGIQEITRRTFEILIKEQRIHSEEYNDADSEFSGKCISIQRNLTPNHPRETTISKVIDNITQNTGIL